MALKPDEAGLLLTFAQVYDNRTFDATTAESWAISADPEVTFDIGRAAIANHYRKTREFIMISDINDYSKDAAKVRRERIQAAGLPDFPSGLTLAEEREYRVLFNNCVGDGMSRTEAERYTDGAFRVDRGGVTIGMPENVRLAIEEFKQRTEIPRAQRVETNE